MESVNDVQELTIYQLSKNLDASYKAVRAIVEGLEAKGILRVISHSANSHAASIYAFDSATIQAVESALQEKGKKMESAASANVLRTLEELKNLHKKVQESAEKIKMQDELLRNRDKEIQDLTNINVRLDADLKIAQGEIKLITDKSSTFEAENARLNQTIKELEQKGKVHTRVIIALGAILLSVFVALCSYMVFVRL